MNNGRAGSGRGGGRGGRSNDARASYQASSQANGARQTGPGSKVLKPRVSSIKLACL